MLEQQLINAFMKFTAKAGAGSVIRNFINDVDINGNPKSWTHDEMQRAIEFLNSKTEAFGTEDAVVVIRTLMNKFDIPHETLIGEPVPDKPGIQGLQ